jgi:hypothetical protein
MRYLCAFDSFSTSSGTTQCCQIKPDMQSTYNVNTEARSHNHCCHGKAVKYYIFWVMSKRPQLQHSFNVMVLNILLYVSAFQNAVIRLLSFSAFHDIGHHLSMFISESLMMAFWNAETCRSILSTNTLNEWFICWSCTHKKMHGPNCKTRLCYTLLIGIVCVYIKSYWWWLYSNLSLANAFHLYWILTTKSFGFIHLQFLICVGTGTHTSWGPDSNGFQIITSVCVAVELFIF